MADGLGVGRLTDDARLPGHGADDGPHVVSVHTLLPVPGGGVLDVVLASPQTRIADALLDLFDAVSGTFAWAENPAQDPAQDPVPDPVG